MNRLKKVSTASLLVIMMLLNSSYNLAYSSSKELNKTDNMQSPINIEEKIVENEDPKIDKIINYNSDNFIVNIKDKVLNISPESDKNNIIIDGNTYFLDKIQIHSPSEHQLNGNHFDMELQIVNKNEQGETVIFGIFIKKGMKNTALSKIWSKFSKENTMTEYEEINLMNLFPVDKTKYTYMGSLTTPPYTEGVKWYIFREPIQMSTNQINKFKSIFMANNRPIQPLNGRKIYKVANMSIKRNVNY